MNFRDMELDFDVYELETAKAYEDALNQVIESSKLIDGKSGLPENIKEVCEVIFGFFDDLFGEGFHKQVFGEKTNLRECLAAFKEFTTSVQAQKDELKDIVPQLIEAPTPNRAARRAASRG